MTSAGVFIPGWRRFLSMWVGQTLAARRARLQYGALLDQRESLASSIMSMGAGEPGGRAKNLLTWLRQREDEMAALLAELVAIPTENPPGKNYHACADLLESRLRQCCLECE